MVGADRRVWGIRLAVLAAFLVASWSEAVRAADAPPAAEAAVPAWKKLPRSQGPAPKTVCMDSSTTAADYSGASGRIDPEQAKSAGVRFWTGSVGQIADALNGGSPPGGVLTGAPTDDPGTGVRGGSACSGYLADWASVEAKRKADLAAARKQELTRANRGQRLVSSPNLDQLLRMALQGEK
jgi:hypothetical protein